MPDRTLTKHPADAPPAAETANASGLTFRQALNACDDVPADIAAHGADADMPLVTIAVPTYRRPELLVESVASALAQDFGRPVEIIVVDNDPASTPDFLMSRLPELASRNFRYFVNGQNIGPFQNWNRCIELARGEWVTILNDDDLLDEHYLSLMFAEIKENPDIDGIICGKRMFSAKEPLVPKASLPAPKSPGVWRDFVKRIMTRRGLGDLYWHLRGRINVEMLYLGKMSRLIPARKFFWGAILGNSGGFLFRREKAFTVGGFYPEEYPSADFGFFVRFAKIAHLRQHRQVAASIRKTENNITVRTVSQQLKQGSRIQRSLIGKEVPSWYRHILPFSLAHDRVDFRNIWGVDIPQAEIEEAVQMKLPAHRPGLIGRLRFWLRGR